MGSATPEGTADGGLPVAPPVVNGETTQSKPPPDHKTTDNHDGLRGFQLLRQVLLGMAVSLTTASTGAHSALPAVALPTMLSNSTDLQLTLLQGTWFASAHSLSGIAGAALGGFCVHRLGPRRTLLVQAVPSTAGWLLIALATSFPMLMVGRCLVGATSGLSVSAAQVYLGECSSPQIRGRIVCMNGMFVNIGTLLVFVLGVLVPWRWIAAASILTLQVPGFIGVLFIPESPYWLMGKKKFHHARNSLKTLRDGNDELADRELQIIEKACRARHKTLTWRELGAELRKLSVLAPFLTIEALFFLRLMTGVATILTYAVIIFQETGSPLGAYESAIVIGSLRLFNASCCVLYVSDHFGRRTLLIFSGVGCTLVGLALAAFLLLRDRLPDWTGWTQLQWLPLPLVMLWLVAFDYGFARTGWVVHSELLPNRVRSALSGVGVLTHYLTSFIAVFSFPYIREACTLGGTFTVYAGFSFLCLLLVFFFIPETKNQRLETIEAFYTHRFGKHVTSGGSADCETTNTA